jgi:hypothetical protein
VRLSRTLRGRRARVRAVATGEGYLRRVSRARTVRVT